MTRILFFHSAPDRLSTAAEWLRRARGRRQEVTIYAPHPEVADRIDRLLWTQPATGFLPHCRAAASLAGETPILIADRIDSHDTISGDRCLLNLSDEVPPGFSRFGEVVEIVSTQDADRLPARDRFRFYREHGHAPENLDVSGGLQDE